MSLHSLRIEVHGLLSNWSNVEKRERFFIILFTDIFIGLLIVAAVMAFTYITFGLPQSFLLRLGILAISLLLYDSIWDALLPHVSKMMEEIYDEYKKKEKDELIKSL